MDGGGIHGHSRLVQERLLEKPSLFRQHMPMKTALDRFLENSRRHFPSQLDHVEINPSEDLKEKKSMMSSLDEKSTNNGFGYDYGDNNSIVGSCSYHNQSGVGETWLGFVNNGLDFDGRSVGESLMKINYNEYARSTNEISGGAGSHQSSSSTKANPKRKRTPPSGLIKGQWTQEEDRVLVGLVTEHGEQNWSQIAKHLTGRIGKQCRERWNNHLRPNVKKDKWSEEEERLLVEAHEKLGNKWSEIAKHIPGRTENTIKNHWNAARRRQNTRRKNKPANSHRTSSSGGGVSTVLDDYIRAKNLHTTSAARTSTNNAATKASPSHGTTSTTASLDPPIQVDTEITDSFHELSQFRSYEDEVMFMQTFFNASLTYQPLQPFQQQLPSFAPPGSLPLEQNYSSSNYNSYYELGQAEQYRPMLSSSEASFSGLTSSIGYGGNSGYEDMKEHKRSRVE